MSEIAFGKDYDSFLLEVKEKIKSAQIGAALAVSRKLINLYWQLGSSILERQKKQGWGAKVIDQLASDLRFDFPGVAGFSSRNLKYMRAFADAYPENEIVQRLLHDFPLPWGHHVRILDKVKSLDSRLWYIRSAHQHGWSRAVLEYQIESDLYTRQGKAVSNFRSALPPPQSDLAQQVLKDPYNFDFLTLGADAQERHLERGLLDHLRSFLLEMGSGFAFVGSQYHLVVSGQDYYLDLLFYHLSLRCFVAVDLKMGAFEPEFAGKMNFYLSAVDDLLRHPDDQPSIGIILCKTRDKLSVEYALRNTATPIGVAEFVTSLPPNLVDKLPSVEEMEAELSHTSALGRPPDFEENELG